MKNLLPDKALPRSYVHELVVGFLFNIGQEPIFGLPAPPPRRTLSSRYSGANPPQPRRPAPDLIGWVLVRPERRKAPSTAAGLTGEGEVGGGISF